MNALRFETGWPPQALSPNARPHWSARRKAAQTAMNEAFWEAYRVGAKEWAKELPPGARFNITIRAEPDVERGRDKDNLVAQCKASLDGLAAVLGVNDTAFEAPTIEWGDRHRGGRLIFEIEAKP